MSKTQTITVELEIPVGYECIGFRSPKKGESFLDTYAGEVRTVRHNYRADYVAMDKDGKWYAFMRHPKKTEKHG